MLDDRGGLGNKQGVPNTIKTEFEDFFRGNINNFGWQLVPRFDNSDRKCKLAACQVGQLMTKFEMMDLLVSRRTHRWGGSPSHGVCYTPRPSPPAIGNGPTTVDPVFRAVIQTGNARDLSLAELPASGDALSDRCPSPGTVIMPE